jgi:invasion protein IalB
LSVAAAAICVLVTTLCLADASAQTQKPPAAQGQAIPLPAASTGHTDITNYDNWTVTCRDAKEKRACTAELDIFQEANGGKRSVFEWLIGNSKDGTALVTVMRFLPGISIVPGVDLKFADRPVRKIPIVVCEPSHCEASTTIDEAFIRDAQAVQQSEAVITASDGRQVTFTINLKGFAQALAAVRK